MAKKTSGAGKPRTTKKAAADKPDGRLSWLDDESGESLIHAYAERLNSFLEAMADGRVDSKELDEQEKRLVKLLKKVEPKLDEALHQDVTELLCELTAYNIMHTLFEIAEAQPKTKFRG